jgi:hypothetical protein
MTLVHSIARRAAATVIAVTMMAAPLQAQTIVAGNLGPGNTYQHGVVNSWRTGFDGTLTPPQQFDNAVSFTYTGVQAAQVLDFSWVVNYFSGPDAISASWFSGPDISTATFMGVSGSWPASLATQGQELFLTTGGGGIMLQPNQTYWLAFTTPLPSQSIWGLQQNDQGQTGYWSRSWDVTDPLNPVDGGWFQETGATPAFQVRIIDAVTTPEPATLALTATGLLFLGGVRLRRRQ